MNANNSYQLLKRPEKSRLYALALHRMRRMGLKDTTAYIVALAEEIEHYRAKIV